MASLAVRPILWEKSKNSTSAGSFHETAGIKSSRDRVFHFEILGLDLHYLIETLVKAASSTSDFDQIRKFVLFADEIKRQAREQGF